MFNSMPAEPAARRGRGRLAPGRGRLSQGERTAFRGRENGSLREGARLCLVHGDRYECP